MNLRRIVSFGLFDIRNTLRDSLVVYVIAAPFLIAAALRLFLPGVESAPAAVAVESAQGSTREVERVLGGVFRVEIYADAEGVAERVGASDAVAGLVREGDGWTILFEGNEEDEFRDSTARTIDRLLHPPRGIVFETVSVGTGNPVREYAAVFLCMISFLMGGIAIGFAMIEEKEQNVSAAFRVSPLTGGEYTAARGFLAVGAGFATALIGHLVFIGAGPETGWFLLALAASAAVPLIVTIAVGGISANQIQAIAVIKVLMLVFFTLPLVSVFVGPSWQWPFYALPNYWMFRTLLGVYRGLGGGTEFFIDTAVTAGVGLLYLAGIAILYRRRRS